MRLVRQPDVEVRLAHRRVRRNHHKTGMNKPQRRRDAEKSEGEGAFGKVPQILLALESFLSVSLRLCGAIFVSRAHSRPASICRVHVFRSWFIACVWALVLEQSVLAAGAAEQYTVERFALRVVVNPDASVGLAYDFTLLLHYDAATLSELFFPLPNANFELKQIRAAINQQPLTDLRQDRHGEPGFWLRLGPRALKRGDRGTLHIELTLADMVAADPRQPGGALFEMEPPALAGMSPQEVGDVAVALHALPGIKPDELRASGGRQVKTGEFDGRATIAWRWPQGKLAQIGALRASFPSRGLSRLAPRSPLGGPIRWLERTWWARIVIGAALVAVFWFSYFRCTQGRGMAAFLVLTGVLVGLMAMSAAAQLVLVPALLLLIGLGELYLWRTRSAAAEEAAIDEDIDVEVMPVEEEGMRDEG